MGKLVYGSICSLDGYINDAAGKFDWAAPDAEVHAFVNDLERPCGTYLYGRRMYELMAVWETDPSLAEHSAETADYAQIWRGADKIVFSNTLAEPTTERTRIVRSFDPAAITTLKDEVDHDLGIGGPTLAAAAIRAGLVDEYYYLLVPELVGSGTPAIPADARVSLDLTDERRFGNGAVYLRYRTR